MIYQSIILVSEKVSSEEVIKRLSLPEISAADIWQNSQDEQSSVSIQTIHDLNGWLALMPYNSEVKLAIIWQAEKLTTEAQNALLKNLEEPPKSSLVVLVTLEPLKLLPTILSRCRLEMLSNALKDTSDKDALISSTQDWQNADYLKKLNLIQTWLKERKREWFIKLTVKLLENELEAAKQKDFKTENLDIIRKRISLLKQIYLGLEHNANLQPALETLALSW